MPLVPVYLNLPIADVRRLVLAIADAHGIRRDVAIRTACHVMPALALDGEVNAMSDADELPPVLRDTDPAPAPDSDATPIP